MPTKEQIQEHALLVRHIESEMGAKGKLNTEQLQHGDAVLKRAFVLLPDMQLTHVMRVLEAVNSRDYPSETVLAMRHQCQMRLAKHWKLSELRATKVPGPAAAPAPTPNPRRP